MASLTPTPSLGQYIRDIALRLACISSWSDNSLFLSLHRTSDELYSRLCPVWRPVVALQLSLRQHQSWEQTAGNGRCIMN